jgi:hypothetical protein
VDKFGQSSVHRLLLGLEIPELYSGFDQFIVQFLIRFLVTSEP